MENINNIFDNSKTFVEIYIEEMKEIRDTIKELSKTEDLFNKNKNKIHDLIWKLGTKYYCFRSNVEKYHRNNPDEYIYERHLSGKLNKFFVIPGGHDFNLCLKYFSCELFLNYYNVWLDDISIFIDSNAILIPRFYIEENIDYFKNLKDVNIKKKHPIKGAFNLIFLFSNSFTFFRKTSFNPTRHIIIVKIFI